MFLGRARFWVVYRDTRKVFPTISPLGLYQFVYGATGRDDRRSGGGHVSAFGVCVGRGPNHQVEGAPVSDESRLAADPNPFSVGDSDVVSHLFVEALLCHVLDVAGYRTLFKEIENSFPFCFRPAKARISIVRFFW
jgi:hypothetical protein